MWTFIFSIIIIIIGKFIFDSFIQSKKMKEQGGMKKKYAQLIQLILDADPRVKIIQETNTFINIGISGAAGAQSFLLQQTFGTLTVQIIIKNNPLFGNMKIERTFPENMDQKIIMEQLLDAQKEEIFNKVNRYTQ